MAIATPLGNFTHDHDEATGADRYVLSVDMIGLSALGLAWILTVFTVRRRRSQRRSA